MADRPISERLEDLQKRKEQARQPGSERSVQRQHDRGKMLARERIEYLLDEGSFHELDMLARHRNPDIAERPYTDGVITGWGTVEGRKVFVFSQDFTLFGGALGEVFAEKIHKVMDLALKVGAPVVGLNDGAGARIQEGPVSLASYGGIFYRNVKASGVTPQISVIMGPCAGGAVYSPAMTDFIFMVAGHVVHVHHRPRRGEDGDRRGRQPAGARRRPDPRVEVGHRHVHRRPTTRPCLDDVRYLLSLPPVEQPRDRTGASRRRRPRRPAVRPSCSTSCPTAPTCPTTCARSSRRSSDDGEFFEYFPNWAQNIVCGFARLGGQSVGVVGNQPMYFAGVLDIESSEKAARFVRTCDAFNIPLVTFVDVPGFLPGVDQEHNGIIRHGAKLLYAYCEATVPRIQVITRKAYGGAYVVMDSKSIGADLAYAWPSRRAGRHGRARVRSRSSTAARSRPPTIRSPRRPSWSTSTRERWLTPYIAAERGYVDDVIDPADTRRHADRRARSCSRSKKEELPPRKHGNVPL